ncbi:MAG: Spy/CpxP family protein refolding chaperone [Gammaproteobacteria bacterium]
MRTSTHIGLAVTIVVALATAAGAQHSGHGAHAGGGDHHHAVQACITEFEQVVAGGRGAGMAFAADQNGYPGPMHILELRERLALTADQVAKAEALMRAMFDESRPKSARLLDAEARLRRLFAAGGADESAIRTAVADVERARTDVRLVHLLTHVRARDLLTEQQRRLYHDARWGAH